MVSWQIGYAQDCNSCQAGSIPAEISINSIEVILCLICRKDTIEPQSERMITSTWLARKKSSVIHIRIAFGGMKEQNNDSLRIV